MKKIVVFFLVLTFVFQNASFGQNAYYDARQIRESMKNLKFGKNSLPLFFKYFPGKTEGEVAQFIADNPYLAPYFEPGAASSIPKFLSSIGSLGSLGGVNVTNFADGLAKFLVKRFKEELSVTFFEKFKEEMEKEEYEDLRTLFPETYILLQTIDNDIYRFNAFLNAMRAAFVKDLTNLYDNFKTVVISEKHKVFFDAHKELYTVITNAIYFIDQYVSGVHPGQALANYDPDRQLNFCNSILQENVRSSVKTLQLFSNSIQSISDTSWWVSSDSVRSLLKDKVAEDLYLGIIFFQARTQHIAFRVNADTLRLDTILAKGKRAGDFIDKFRLFIGKLCDNAQAINRNMTLLKAKEKNDDDNGLLYKLITSSTKFLENGIAILDLPLVNLGDSVEAVVKRNLNRFLFCTRTGGELYMDIKTKNYSSAILNTVAIIDSAFIITGTGFKSEVRLNIIRYGTFMANVASAENSDQVQNAIEAIALPVGSASIKKKSKFSMSLNAYVGGFWGNEYIADKATGNWRQITGMSAPLGVNFSWPLNVPFKEGSISAFLSLIDVGSIASFRLKDDSTAHLPEVKLQNIFAPGLGIIYGVPKWPVSIGYTLQLGPALREITAEAITASDKLNFRWQFFLAVDIPLINFYTKPK